MNRVVKELQERSNSETFADYGHSHVATGCRGLDRRGEERPPEQENRKCEDRSDRLSSSSRQPDDGGETQCQCDLVQRDDPQNRRGAHAHSRSDSRERKENRDRAGQCK